MSYKVKQEVLIVIYLTDKFAMNMDKFFHQIHVQNRVRNPTFKKINLSNANSNLSEQLKYKFCSILVI